MTLDREASIARARAVADQHRADLDNLVRWVRNHRDVCEFPPPLCPSDPVWTHLDHLNRSTLEQMLVVALFELALQDT